MVVDVVTRMVEHGERELLQPRFLLRPTTRAPEAYRARVLAARTVQTVQALL